MKLISTKDYLLLIDKVEGFKSGDWNYEIDNAIQIYQFSYNIEKYPGNKIIAYYPLTNEAEELDLPLLPNPFEDSFDITSWAKDEHKYNHRSIHELSFILGCEVGYKAATKQFSLEDMKKAFNAGYDLNTWEQLGIPNEERDYLNEIEFIESLSTQQLPKEFIPIMKCGRCYKPDDNEEDCWSAKECSRNTDFKDKLKTTTNSEGKEETQGTYKY